MAKEDVCTRCKADTIPITIKNGTYQESPNGIWFRFDGKGRRCLLCGLLTITKVELKSFEEIPDSVTWDKTLEEHYRDKVDATKEKQ